MNLAIFIVIASVLALLVILRVAISRSLQVRSNTELVGQIERVDVEAFRNLVNPADDEYLRAHLRPRRFRRVRRARLRATAAYVQVAGKNAAVLVRIGEASLASGNPQTTNAARQLINEALLLRRNSALALAKIYLAMVWPGAHFTTGRIVEGYEHLNGSAMLLGRLQNPTNPVRLSATR
jgi:hypothetical protein